MRSFTSFQSILLNVARNQGFDNRLFEHRLQNNWKGLVGDVLAPHTWPTRIRFGKLFVIVENSVWLHQLMYLKSTLLQKIQTESPGLPLSDIIFRIGEIPHPMPVDLEKSQEPIMLLPEALSTATEHTIEINDHDLRNSLTQVIAKALSSLPNSPIV